MPRLNEKTRLLPAVQAVCGSASNKLWIKRCMIILGVVTALVLSGLSSWWLVFDDNKPVATTDKFICGDTKNEAGYVKMANKEDDHYFYWFFESHTSPEADPLVLWLTGGPGGSGLFALLAENGPCTIQPDLSTRLNPYSWNRKANVIWLDQPTGTGFSFGSPADTDYNETNVGENIYWFLQGFLEKHPNFQNRGFFLTGESYGGHYVPAAAHYIWEMNQKSGELPIINLQGLAIGNSLTNAVIQYAHYQDMNHNRYNITLLTDAQVEQMRIDSVECIELTRECQTPSNNETLCLLGLDCWDKKLVQPLSKANRNNYDIREPCNNSDPDAICGDFPIIAEYLNSPAVREYLNVDEHAPAWVEENEVIHTRFIADGDWAASYGSYVGELLNDGLRVLIYAGDADLMCNWIGNRAWTLDLDWRGKDGYNTAEKRTFIAHDPLLPIGSHAIDAGEVWTFENFAFVRVYDAGHMVPTNQPAVSLDLINRFLANKAL
ncbi:hypothetical protein PC129_g1580 [Phytophthora cactorum]|uniref:Carboxypeptidase n=1 Tax=Phytophthora cactorum TaxID=29920 RepID=A0A329SYP8_9STRA|nr:hypothetical protein Pcac1_g14408 [Phytophthora cactorum]KAG2827520.1 hypothetical protein PC111_g8549 [Phytophthora cactorum]KAG2831190.1 hypothetical protein PC112_g7378 [Phytophthora cactorum]KAG2865758.1 hypothetical protein PC113_g3412 [Phytophthora cactorum]KAG2904275.1 hypothetical protein PC114_g11908 [Phytophthora cactorum]